MYARCSRIRQRSGDVLQTLNRTIPCLSQSSERRCMTTYQSLTSIEWADCKGRRRGSRTLTRSRSAERLRVIGSYRTVSLHDCSINISCHYLGFSGSTEYPALNSSSFLSLASSTRPYIFQTQLSTMSSNEQVNLAEEGESTL